MVAETQQEPGTLSAMDIRALRECDTVSFHWASDHSYLDASKHLDKPTPWETDRGYQIQAPSHISDYERTPEAPKPRSAFAMLHSPRFSPEWQTVVQALKPGDRLQMRWVANNSNQYMLDNHITEDMLYLCATREQHGKTIMLKWFLANSITPTGSFGRLVRFF